MSDAPRAINAAGLALVKEFEGLRLVAYDDLQPGRRLKAGDGVTGTLTIGHGHTGADVFIGQRLSAEQAEALLRDDLREAGGAVEKAVRRPAGDNAYAAMVSLAFNIGGARFARSSVCRCFNAGDMAGAAAAFALWNKAGGAVLPGLVRRRAAEAALFLKPPSKSRRPATESPDAVRPSLSPLARSQAAMAAATAAVAPVAAWWRDLQGAVEGLPGWAKGLVVTTIVGAGLWICFGRGGGRRPSA